MEKIMRGIVKLEEVGGSGFVGGGIFRERKSGFLERESRFWDFLEKERVEKN